MICVPRLLHATLPHHRSSLLMKTLLQIAVSLIITVPTASHAADDEGVQFFELKIRPVLVQQCYGCHSVRGP